MKQLLMVVVVVGLVPACGSSSGRPGRGTGDGGGSGTDGGLVSRPDTGPCTPSGAENTPETCSDGVDNDCDGLWDCSDELCSGVGSCPVCGSVDTMLGAPLALPDGTGSGDCTSNADCDPGEGCFEVGSDPILGGSPQVCRESYSSTLNFIGFSPDAVFADQSYLEPFQAESNGQFLFLGDPIPLGGGVGMGLRQSDVALREAFDAAIGSMKADGSLNALLTTWFGEDQPLYE